MTYDYIKNPRVYASFEPLKSCALCGRVGSYVMEANFSYCDCCIKSGDAYEDCTERDGDTPNWDIPDQPQIWKWQGWSWPGCCKRAMVHICELSKETIQSYAGDLTPIEFLEKYMDECNNGEDFYECLREKDEMTEKGVYDLRLHLFECNQCQRKYIQFDAS